MPNLEEPTVELDSHLKWIVKNGFFVFLGIILSKLFMYIYRVIIARYYGPEIYGLFVLGLMVTGWFIAIASFGLNDGLLRYIPLYRGKSEIKKIKYITRVTTTILTISGITAGILLFLSSEFISNQIFHDSNLIIFLKIFSITVPISILAGTYLSILRAFEKIQWYSFIINVLQNLVRVVGILLLILIGIKTNAIIYSYVLSIAIMLIAAYLVCKYKIPEIFGMIKIKNNDIKKEIISYSWPLMFSSIIYSLFYWIDSFIIGYFKTVVDVGIYNIAVPLSGLMNVVPDLFSQIFLPLITKEYAKKNIEIIKNLSQQLAKWIFIVNLPLFLIMFIFPGAVINILFGSQYLAAENILRIMIIGGLIISLLGSISNNLLLMAGKSKLILKNTILFSIINLILGVIMVIKYGMIGAAIATTTCQSISSLVLFIQAKHYLSINLLRTNMLKILLISLIPALLLVYARQYIPITIVNIILMGLLFLLVYFIFLILTRCFDKNDLMIIKAIRNKLYK